jgi:hypothetical protein
MWERKMLAVAAIMAEVVGERMAEVLLALA